jgi:thiol:disulfide interchange protein DsbC
MTTRNHLYRFAYATILTFSLLDIACAEDPRTEMTRTFPNLTVESFRPAPIPGLYEVVAGDQIFYWADNGYMVFGEIWSKEGKSLTAARREEIASIAVKNLPLKKAVVIGNGKHQIIEFTDPDCPYCRKVDSFLASRSDVTRHIFFFPLSIHPHAANKAKLILCSQDKAATYKTVLSGRYDSIPIPSLAESCDGEGILKEHLALATKLGVRGTPNLWIDGVQVSGADIPRMEELLMDSHANLPTSKGDVTE